jgi:anti-sigma regulatory factor (Ser/Thr protein kinase)
MTTSARTPATGTPGYSEVMPCVPASARRARGLVSIALQVWGLDSLTDAGLLVVSELVTNVLDHTQCHRLHVSVHRLDDDRARIVVADGSPQAPKVARADGDSLGGRGLVLIDALSHHWGYEWTRSGKSVWAELRRENAGLEQRDQP